MEEVISARYSPPFPSGATATYKLTFSEWDDFVLIFHDDFTIIRQTGENALFENDNVLFLSISVIKSERPSVQKSRDCEDTLPYLS